MCMNAKVLYFIICLSILNVSAIAQITPPSFSFIQRNKSTKEILLRLSATKNTLQRIETSPDLSIWTPLVIAKSTGYIQYTDSGAPFPQTLFYRAVQLDGTNILTGDCLGTTNGTIIFHPINHASFVMDLCGTIAYVDPVGGSSPYAGLPKADIVFVTHEHSDHYDSATINAIARSNAIIVVNKSVYSLLPSTLKARAISLTNNQSTFLNDMIVDAVPAYNLTQSYHPKGRDNGYVLTVYGKKIYISGDTEDIPEIKSLTDIDVAFVCMNLPYTMSVSTAANLVRQFKPKVVYPYHSRDSNVAQFKSLVGLDLGIEVRIRTWY